MTIDIIIVNVQCVIKELEIWDVHLLRGDFLLT